MKKKLGIVMDPIEKIQISHDGSFSMLLAAQARGFELFYMEGKDLYAQNGIAYGSAAKLRVEDNAAHWFDLSPPTNIALNTLDIILMRVDPPVTMDYIYLTHLLELAEKNGVRVINAPAALRDVNEKNFILWFPDCIAPTLISRDSKMIRAFIAEHEKVIIKPLDGMGGKGIFYITPEDKNVSVILETMTNNNRSLIMVQRYIPEIALGDKRIILIDGEPFPYALARVAAPNEIRANMAAGGKGHCVPLSARDKWLCERIGPTLRQKGLFLVGLDVIKEQILKAHVERSPEDEVEDLAALDHLAYQANRKEAAKRLNRPP
ncbi:MAG: glutathione synthase, partial [Gammaproteobacteria bacterium]|nr:glutathione synthase [Gammaproteobacteria bacterium]